MRGQNGCERTLNGILAIFLPPVSVALVTGCSTKGATHVLINLVLYVVLWIPAVIHAWYIIHHYRNGFYEDEPRVVYVQGAPANQQGHQGQHTHPQQTQQTQQTQQSSQFAPSPAIPPYPNQKQAPHGQDSPQPYPSVLNPEQPEYSLPSYTEAQHTGQSVQAGRPDGDTKL